MWACVVPRLFAACRAANHIVKMHDVHALPATLELHLDVIFKAMNSGVQEDESIEEEVKKVFVDLCTHIANTILSWQTTIFSTTLAAIDTAKTLLQQSLEKPAVVKALGEARKKSINKKDLLVYFDHDDIATFHEAASQILSFGVSLISLM